MAQTSVETSEIFGHLAFRYPFRKYQRMILARVESGQGDRKYHIVAPPGSGKTIVGIELVRRFGAPAVIFAPTTTIQQQWREKVGMFTGEGHAEEADRLTSLDPARLAPINIFTYQLISTPGQAREMVQQMARQAWVEELLAGGEAGEQSAAEARLAGLQRDNPHEYARELAHRYLRIKRRLLQQDEADLASFLHPNARRLIDELVAYGVKTVVLDECHHLLDYWAIVLRHLIRQIPEARVVGLTATLPDPESEREYENYLSLVGEVDFEVPTPAVVKEGDLAPYRDLVYFVQPTERENAYLREIQDTFERAIADLANSRPFVDWVSRLVLERPGEDGGSVPWEDFLDGQPLLALAGLRFLMRAGYPIPTGLVLPREAEEDMGMEDWFRLLERYALDVLKAGLDPEDHERLSELRHALLPFGLSITRRGLRRGRSPGDLALALSEAKDSAVALILLEESEALGERLRAVVVTDFETTASAVEHKLAGVLERDAGSAVRVLRYLANDRGTEKLHPVLATGGSVMIGAHSSAPALEYFNSHLRARGMQTTCALKETAFPGVLQVIGENSDWSPRVYVPLLTEAFEAGITKCLVGTRGIFGEGWDSLGLNTLIDLTGATTSTAVQQLRGRCVRLDPSWPRKVAHNWDVVCVAPQFARGDTDLERFVRRHSRYWGVVPTYEIGRTALSHASDMPVAESAGPEGEPEAGAEGTAEIVKGVSHVDPDLAWELAVKPFSRVNFDTYTVRMLNEIRWRDRSYDNWGIGQDYGNLSYSTARLQVDDLKIRTVFTVQKTLKRMLQEFRIGKTLLVEQRSDAILLDVGRAVLLALRGEGLVSRDLRAEHVRVFEEPDGSYRVLLDHASPDDTATFVEAYTQVFEPVVSQRYLVLRDDARLPNLGPALMWLALRPWLPKPGGYGRAYHPVPAALASRKERAERYAYYWRQYVGGGRLVFTRSEEGRRVLLQARAQRRPRVKSMAFEVWK